MNILKNVINKLSQEEKKEVNLASEKVELARKAPSVQKDLQNLDAKLKKAEDKIDKSYTAYKKNWSEFQSVIKEVAQDRKSLEGDVAEIAQIALDLGVSFSDVKGLKEAQDLSRKLDGLVKDLPKLYKEPK